RIKPAVRRAQLFDPRSGLWRRMKMKTVYLLPLALSAAMISSAGWAETCPQSGQLDSIYCNVDGDLVADPPTDPADFRDPSTLVWSYTPVEDPALYANTFKPFTDHLETCLGKSVV